MALVIFLIGACIGSFYLVLGLRLPKEENPFIGRSECDNCHHKLAFWQMFPVLSYIFLGGKCYYCKKHISILNPLVELIVAFLFLFAYLHYGISYEMFMFMITSSLVVIIYISDFKYMIINDTPLVVSSILIFILKFIYYGRKEALISLSLGILMFTIMYLIKILGDKMFHRESLGGGEIKFAFVIGIAVGYKLGLCVLILSCFLAIPYSLASYMLKKNNEVPYGPFLASSLFVVSTFSYKFLKLLELIFISL